ncbi:hypothetical protein G4B88_017891 [Cannabis sativa]|uniref:Uncharacterized protein n=1 Tax=Cannabis sativa TaxID=3483 RepID=A0A7J6EHR6_CANSA|nr:hypothetical protein G4B88_017891 [Cannabis sativa]
MTISDEVKPSLATLMGIAMALFAYELHQAAITSFDDEGCKFSPPIARLYPLLTEQWPWLVKCHNQSSSCSNRVERKVDVESMDL